MPHMPNQVLQTSLESVSTAYFQLNSTRYVWSRLRFGAICMSCAKLYPDVEPAGLLIWTA